MFSSYVLWVIAAALVAVLFLVFRIHNKTAKPFELFTEVSTFITKIQTRVEILFTEIKGISKYLSDLSFRISGISETTKAAAESQLTIAHIEDIVRKIFQEELNKLSGATDSQTEKLFNGLDLQTKVIVSQIEKTLKEKIQTWLQESAAPAAVGTVIAPAAEAETKVKTRKVAQAIIPETYSEAVPETDLTKAGQTALVDDKKA